MNEPNLHHIRYLITAAESGGIAAAAKKLGVSQPAISQAIRKLEEVLDCELLTHSRNRFKLTEEGRLLIERSRPILMELEHLKSELKGLTSEARGPLHIATSSAVAFYFLPPLLQEMAKNHPLIKPVLTFGSVPEIIEKVRSGTAEVGLLIDDGKLSGLERRLIQKGSFRCISAEKDLPETPRFLVTKESPGLYELEKAYKKATGKVAHIGSEVESWEVIAHLAGKGFGVGFVPDFVAENQSNAKVVEKYTLWTQKVEYRLFLLHQGTHQLSKLAKIFLDTF